MKPIQVSVTIDVENPQTPLFEKRFSDNLIWADGHGVERIMSLLEKHGATGSFFTNVYEYRLWGRAEMERAARAVHQRGHEVELHTHPIWVDEKRRENMRQFPLAEQEALIAWGADFIERATGRRPLCHRAGAYGFNQDTLQACRNQGFALDSSNFFGHPNCRAVLTQNQVVEADGLVEAPVTFFMRGDQVVKTDLDWMSEAEFQNCLELFKQTDDLFFINLFMHSYSLLAFSEGFASWRPSPEKEAKLERILALLAGDPEVEFTPISRIAQRGGARLDSLVAPPSQADTPLGVIRDLMAQTGGRTAIFVNSPLAAEALVGLELDPKRASLVSLRREAHQRLRELGLAATGPEDHGYHFIFHDRPFPEIQTLRESGGYSPSRYQYVLDEMAEKLLYANPGIGRYQDYDFYVNGDYNLSNVMGQHALYPIEATVGLLKELNPELVISLDADNDPLESLILQNHLAQKGSCRFFRFNLADRAENEFGSPLQAAG